MKKQDGANCWGALCILGIWIIPVWAYMFSWGVLVDNPYYAITSEDGRFEISDIPLETYALTVWHAGMKTYLERQIVIEPYGIFL